MTTDKFEPFTIHFLGHTTVLQSPGVNGGRAVGYGQEMLVTDAIYELNSDRLGQWPLVDLIDDEDAQVRRWGRVVARRGAWPEDVSRIEPGSYEWDMAREAARRQAWQIEDEQARKAALNDVTRTFGAPPVTSTTAAVYR